MSRVPHFESIEQVYAWANRPKGTTRVSSPRISEDLEQIALMARAKLYLHQYPALSLLIHIPNGGSRHVVEAKKLKAMGVKSGVPDLILFSRARGYGAWCGELKAMDGRLEPEQVEVLTELRARGYFADVFYGQDACWDSLMWYLAKD